MHCIGLQKLSCQQSLSPSTRRLPYYVFVTKALAGRPSSWALPCIPVVYVVTNMGRYRPIGLLLLEVIFVINACYAVRSAFSATAGLLVTVPCKLSSCVITAASSNTSWPLHFRFSVYALSWELFNWRTSFSA